MKKIFGIAAAVLLATTPWVASAFPIAPASPLALNALVQNTSGAPMAVIGFCNATATAADLEGYVGKKKATVDLVASESGTDRKSITLIVPATWWFKVPNT